MRTGLVTVMITGPALESAPGNTEPLHVFVVGLNILLRYFLGSDALLFRTVDNLVIDIRKVSYIGDLVSLADKVVADHVKSNSPAGMAKMGMVVYRDPAGVEQHYAGLDRNKFLFFSGQGVVELYHRQDFLE